MVKAVQNRMRYQSAVYNQRQEDGGCCHDAWASSLTWNIMAVTGVLEKGTEQPV